MNDDFTEDELTDGGTTVYEFVHGDKLIEIRITNVKDKKPQTMPPEDEE